MFVLFYLFIVMLAGTNRTLSHRTTECAVYIIDANRIADGIHSFFFVKV